MIIQGFSLKAYLAIPVILTLLAGGEWIKVYFENARQVSTNKEMSLPSREVISTNATPKTYYVSGTGNDKNSGLTTSSAFRT
ncbi:MAG: right-handed parallel beta-helix repeat-containing protein, partial [Nostoc sp.]